MVAVADVGESWSAAKFVAEADRCIQDILRRGRLPVLVGGTGLYLDALVSGRSFAPGRAGGAVRRQREERLEREGIGPLLEELRAVDPQAAARIAPADVKRILRALEVYRETGETITAHNAADRAREKKYAPLYLGLAFRDRADLKERIGRRVDAMVEQGLLEEARWLFSQDLPRDCTARQAIGYKELGAFLRGEAALDQAVEEVKLRSRQYAKRQLTWLKRNGEIHWIFWDKVPDFDKAMQEATEILTAQGLG